MRNDEEGMTLIEVLAALSISTVLLGGMAILVHTLYSLYTVAGQSEEVNADSTTVFTELQRLAQASTAVGMDVNGQFTKASGVTHVLALRVSDLQGIVPSSSPLLLGSTSAYMDIAFLPRNNLPGSPYVLSIYPGGHAASTRMMYQVYSVYTNFSNSSHFTIDPSLHSFRVSLDPVTNQVGNTISKDVSIFSTISQYTFTLGVYAF